MNWREVVDTLDDSALIDGLTVLSRLATDFFAVDDLSSRLCDIAAKAFDIEGVGVVVFGRDSSVLVQASAPALLELQQLQVDAQSGPCWDAAHQGQLFVATAGTEMDENYASWATSAGVRSVLAVPLVGRGRSWGSLNLFWAVDHVPDSAERAAADLLAAVLVSYVVTASDGVEAQVTREQLAARLLHDQLTGLPNRELIRELISHALAVARRHGSYVMVLFVDLDRFKSINDTHGHLAGDTVLQTVARRMRAALRAGDALARLGGDEFVVLCEDLRASAEDTESLGASLARRLRAAVAAPIRIGAADIRISATVGVAVTAEQISPEALIHQADLAMYQGKAQGREAKTGPTTDFF